MTAEEVRLDRQRLNVLEVQLMPQSDREMDACGSGCSNSCSLIEVPTDKPLSSSNHETSDGSNQTDNALGNCVHSTPAKTTGSDSREFSDEANNVEGALKSKAGSSSPSRKADNRRTRKRTRDVPPSSGDGTSNILTTPDATITKYFRGTSKPCSSKLENLNSLISVELADGQIKLSFLKSAHVGVSTVWLLEVRVHMNATVDKRAVVEGAQGGAPFRLFSPTSCFQKEQFQDNVGKSRMTCARRKLQSTPQTSDNAVNCQADGDHLADDTLQSVRRSSAGAVPSATTQGWVLTAGNPQVANANSETGVYVQTDLTGNDLDRKDRRIAELERSLAEASCELQRCARQQADADKLNEMYMNEHRKLLIEQSILERKERRTKCMEDGLRFGSIRPDHRNGGFENFIGDGYAFVELRKKVDALNAERDEVARATQLLKKRKPMGLSSSKKTGSLVSATAAGDALAKPEALPPLTQQEYYEQEEIFRLRREQFKKEEADLLLEQERLKREQSLYIREVKRLQNEERSRYKDHVTLNKQYLLLSLLGKGGFSEVWRAFDLQHLRYVACKIHQVNMDWSEERKVNYVRHAIREKDIHKSLNHPRVVKLFDVFTIDVNSFCTVLEYCDGNDLDFYLKQNKVIPEKEARSIIMQVVRALKYLNEIKPPVIHYDLKPANILLSSRNGAGEIKITDFGLAKVMEDDKYDPAVGMELTSQGAGTYWYLPPECFDTSPAPKICSKVDVWSLGVIFFQCLYGQKPFGDRMSQSRVLETGTILNATSVVFPAKPQVSNEAKDFICCCLQYSREDRADVFQLYNHEYLKPKSHKMQAAGSSNSSANTSHVVQT
ncbi:kinase domain protein [Trichuris suis]|nr:kinase domain protein [Trichuris suis]